MKQSDRFRIAFAGDISLNDHFLSLEENDSLFSETRNYLDQKKVDIFIANLESPLEGDGNVNVLKYPRLSTNSKAIAALKTLSPDILILGNNHIFDCLENGYRNTVQWLEKNKIDHCGVYNKEKKNQNSHHLSIGSRKLSVLSYVAADTHPSIPVGAEIDVFPLEYKRVLQDIKRESRERFVIVSLHWGVERSHYPSVLQVQWARAFVEAGAGIVMGHHPHTLQGYELWNKGAIFYSLGNFAFSDVLSCNPPVLWTKDQQHGGIAIVDIIDNKVEIETLQVTACIDNRVRLVVSPYWDRQVLKRSKVLNKSLSKYKIFWSFYQFWDSVILPPFRYFFGERKSFIKQIKSVRPRHIKKIFNYFRTYFMNVKGSVS